MAEMPTFVIGDVHGHWERLSALLQAAGILGDCEACRGSGHVVLELEASNGHGAQDAQEVTFECRACEGDGIVRTNFDVRVVQLGDLAHFGGATGSPTGDKLCYEYADKWLDMVLWGNHDRAMVDPASAFKGFHHPGGPVKALMDDLYSKGKLKLATTAHGYLLVHAGVHLGWHNMGRVNGDVDHFAGTLNALSEERLQYLLSGGRSYKEQQDAEKRFRILNAIGRLRGGANHEGGVLWMDWSENHMQGSPFKFICGHTRGDKIRTDDYGNWCIDIGSHNNGRLAGLWLDEGIPQSTVVVDTNNNAVERNDLV